MTPHALWMDLTPRCSCCERPSPSSFNLVLAMCLAYRNCFNASFMLYNLSVSFGLGGVGNDIIDDARWMEQEIDGACDAEAV